MGFLRKVGRKVSKKLKKVFGTKLGSIVGMVGLYFMMGAAAKALSGWASSTFGTATTAASQGAQAADLTAKVGAQAGATFEAKVAADAAVVSTAAADATIASTVSSTGASVGTLMANSTTNADKLNAFMGAQESAVQAGTSASTLSTTLTDAVSTAANDATLLSQTTAEVTANLSAQPIDFTDADFLEMSKDFNVKGSVTPRDPTQGMGNIAKTTADPSRFGTLGPDATGFDQIKRFASDPLGVTRGAIQNTAASAIDYATGPEFIPDTLQAGATGYVNNMLAEEQPQQRGGGIVMGQPLNEIAQSAYMQSVGPQLQNSGLAGVRTFADLSNQTLYGTGTPDYLRSLYQPLPMPSPIQIG